MADGWPRVKYEKIVQKMDFLKPFFDFFIDPRGPGVHPGGSKTGPGAQKRRARPQGPPPRDPGIPGHLYGIPGGVPRPGLDPLAIHPWDIQKTS